MAIEQETENSSAFIDTEPVAAPDGTEDDPNVHIYAYARFRSLEHVAFGLYRTKGGPRDEEVDSEGVGQYGMEPIATYWEFKDALDDIESKHMFEDVPFVEVTSEDDYNEALEALDIDPDDGAWERPGLYDFRDDPPSYVSSVEDYERESMKEAADQAIDFMFQGDDWEAVYRELAEAEEEEEE